MKDDAEFDPAATTRALLRTGRHAALATLMQRNGDPYCSLVNVATDGDGAPILLISRLAAHTRNVLQDGRVCVMIDERRPASPTEVARLMLSGLAEPTDDARVRRRYLQRQPDAAQFAGFADFSFFVVRPRALHLVAGFGRIVNLRPDQFLIDSSTAQSLLDAEAEIIDHLNSDHADTLALYAERLLQAPAGSLWRCVGIDPEGLELQGDGAIRRLLLTQPVTTPQEFRKELKILADRARSGVV